jgi:hypothetical protein
MHFGTWYAFNPQKWILWCKRNLSVHVYGTKLITEMDYQGHTSTTMVGEE